MKKHLVWFDRDAGEIIEQQYMARMIRDGSFRVHFESANQLVVALADYDDSEHTFDLVNDDDIY